MTEATPTEYKDTDFVYVDVPNKKVVGLVEWGKNGSPVKKEYTMTETSDDNGKRRTKKTKRYYPWCSYLTAKRVYNVAGKYIEEGEYESFDAVFTKAIKQTYWSTTRS